MTTTVALQGELASFHHLAAQRYFDDNIEVFSFKTFQSTFDALQNNKATYAVVAIENSLYGSINEVYDLILKYRFWIHGEVYLRIEQCLIGLPDADLDQIKEVHSHPIALAQCDDYLVRVLPDVERFEHSDTAGSVRAVKLWAEPHRVAIASRKAAELHKLKVLASEIETNKHNYTRFVVLSKKEIPNNKANKTSIVIRTDDHRHPDTKPGALYRALGCFAKHSINLTKLESRPIIGKAWHYMFYIDFEAGLDTALAKEALDDLKTLGCEVTVLGSYRSDR